MDKRLAQRIEGTNERIGSLRNELKADIAKVDSRVEDLDKRLDMAQRLAVADGTRKVLTQPEPSF